MPEFVGGLATGAVLGALGMGVLFVVALGVIFAHAMMAFWNTF